MITLHLLRHGETIWHREGRYAGSSDIPLTDKGLAQARALASWASQVDLAAVVTSDLARAIITGQELAAAAGVSPRVDPRFREVDFGQCEGLTRSEMHERFPGRVDAFLERPATHPLPGAERGETALRRALAAVVDLFQTVPEEAEVAVVGHGTIIRLLLCHTVGLPLNEYRHRFPTVENTAVTTLMLPRAATADELAGAGALLRYNCAVA